MAATTQRPFGETLREMRRRAHLTQAGLAERSGVGIRTISDLERGVWQSPRADTARLLADALALTGAERRAFLGAVRDSGRSNADAPATPGLPAPTSVDPPGNNAPRLPSDTPLLGRGDLLGALFGGVLERGASVALVGPGGVGKTRLALEVARLRAEAGWRVVWVPLETVATPEGLLPAIARAAGLTEAHGTALGPRIAEALGTTSTLLVLDNLEQVPGAGAEIAALRADLPAAALLLTSRVAIPLAGVREVLVGPLALPDPAGTPETLAGNPSVALFLGHAARLGGAADGGRDLAAAAEVVRLVDGLPLAIELAAARTATLSTGSVADLLRHTGLRLLNHGAPDRPERQRTMERAIVWSHDLLPPASQALLRLLSAFRGGFTTGLVAAVAAETGTPELVAELPELLRASLVGEVRTGGEPRLALLEPIRLYAAERLDAAGETARVRAAHTAAVSALALRDLATLLGPSPDRALETLGQERANIEAALEHAIATDPRLAARLAARMAAWWELRGEVVSGGRWLERVAAVDAGADPADRLTVRWMAGMFADYRDDIPEQRRWAAETVALAEAIGTPEALGLGRFRLGDLTMLADLDPAAAIVHFDAAVDLLDAGSSPYFLFQALAHRAMARMQLGDPAAALPDIDRALEIQQREGFAAAATLLRFHRANALAATGRADEARAEHAASLRLSERFGSVAGWVLNLTALAALAAEGDDPASRRDALRLLAACEALVTRKGIAWGDDLGRGVAATRARLADGLPAPTVAALEASGQALAQEAATGLALSLAAR